MAQKECTGTIQVTSSVLGNASIQAFLWCEIEDVQAYLDMESTIILGDNFDLATAKRLENHQVYEIIGYLSTVFIITEEAISTQLVVITAKLTAAQIGMGRMAASIGSDLAEWTERLKNESWATLQRIFVHQNLNGDNITTRDGIPLEQRILLAKARERAVVPNV